ncbi:MAG: hypothetical protein QOH29_90 [Actinomycetota bacterium]|nr:hypothetical protein [Actinomycetota bacterium]
MKMRTTECAGTTKAEQTINQKTGSTREPLTTREGAVRCWPW